MMDVVRTRGSTFNSLLEHLPLTYEPSSQARSLARLVLIFSQFFARYAALDAASRAFTSGLARYVALCAAFCNFDISSSTRSNSRLSASMLGFEFIRGLFQ
jgi:hypothetical protein